MSVTSSILKTPLPLSPASETTQQPSSSTSLSSLPLEPVPVPTQPSPPSSRYPPGIENIICKKPGGQQQETEISSLANRDGNVSHSPCVKPSPGEPRSSRARGRHPGYGYDCPPELKAFAWPSKDSSISRNVDQEDTESCCPMTLPTGAAFTRSSREKSILELEGSIADVNRIGCGLNQQLRIYFSKAGMKIELPKYEKLSQRIRELREKLEALLSKPGEVDDMAPEDGDDKIIGVTIKQFRKELDQVIMKGYAILHSWTDYDSKTAVDCFPDPPTSAWWTGQEQELARRAHARHNNGKPLKARDAASKEMELKILGIRGRDVELAGLDKLKKKFEIMKTSGQLGDLSSMVKELIAKVPVTKV